TRPSPQIIRIAKPQPTHRKPVDSVPLHFHDRPKDGQSANTALRSTSAINWRRQSDLRSRKGDSRFDLSVFRNMPEHFGRSSTCVDPRKAPRLIGSKERRVGNLAQVFRDTSNALF